MMKSVYLLSFALLLSLAPVRAQVSLIKDNLAGKDDGVPRLNSVDEMMVTFKGKIVFSGTSKYVDLSTDGDYEPWIYDPATNSLGILRDIVPLKSSNPNKYVVSGDKVYFGATDEYFLVDRLFASDGTRNGTVNMGDSTNALTGMLRNFSRNTIVALNNGVLFNAYVSPKEFGLWFSSGTPAGTIRINKDGFADNFIVHPRYKVALFTQNSTFRISDGTPTGTRVLNDLLNINDVSTASIAMGVYGDNFVMEALDPNTGTFGFFMTDGITSKYTKLVDFGNLPSQARNVADLGNGKFAFSNKRGIWVSDGTPSGTKLVPGLVPFTSDNFYTDLWTVYKGKVYFAASDPTANKGIELYSTDGTVAGTGLVADINAGAADAKPYNLKVYNEVLYFSATTSASGNELWLTDGTSAGTKLLADINAGSGSSNPQYITGYGNDLFFFASDGKTGYELWKYAGAKVGVQNVLQQNDVTVYPSLVQDLVHMELESGSADRAMLVDMSGKVIRSASINGEKTSWNLGDLDRGNYLLLFYKNAHQVCVRKIVRP